MRHDTDRRGPDVLAHEIAIAHEPGHDHAVAEPEVVAQRLDQASLGAVAHDHEACVRAVGRNQCKGPHEHRKVDPAGEQADEHGVATGGIEPGASARDAAFEHLEAVDVDAVRQHLDAVCGHRVALHDDLLDPRRDRDEAGSEARRNLHLADLAEVAQPGADAARASRKAGAEPDVVHLCNRAVAEQTRTDDGSDQAGVVAVVDEPRAPARPHENAQRRAIHPRDPPQLPGSVAPSAVKPDARQAGVGAARHQLHGAPRARESLGDLRHVRARRVGASQIDVGEHDHAGPRGSLVVVGGRPHDPKPTHRRRARARRELAPSRASARVVTSSDQSGTRSCLATRPRPAMPKQA